MGGPNKPVGDKRLTAILDAVDAALFRTTITDKRALAALLTTAIAAAARKPLQGKGKL